MTNSIGTEAQFKWLYEKSNRNEAESDEILEIFINALVVLIHMFSLYSGQVYEISFINRWIMKTVVNLNRRFIPSLYVQCAVL